MSLSIPNLPPKTTLPFCLVPFNASEPNYTYTEECNYRGYCGPNGFCVCKFGYSPNLDCFSGEYAFWPGLYISYGVVFFLLYILSVAFYLRELAFDWIKRRQKKPAHAAKVFFFIFFVAKVIQPIFFVWYALIGGIPSLPVALFFDLCGDVGSGSAVIAYIIIWFIWIEMTLKIENISSNVLKQLKRVRTYTRVVLGVFCVVYLISVVVKVTTQSAALGLKNISDAAVIVQNVDFALSVLALSPLGIFYTRRLQVILTDVSNPQLSRRDKQGHRSVVTRNKLILAGHAVILVYIVVAVAFSFLPGPLGLARPATRRLGLGNLFFGVTFWIRDAFEFGLVTLFFLAIENHGFTRRPFGCSPPKPKRKIEDETSTQDQSAIPGPSADPKDKKTGPPSGFTESSLVTTSSNLVSGVEPVAKNTSISTWTVNNVSTTDNTTLSQKSESVTPQDSEVEVDSKSSTSLSSDDDSRDSDSSRKPSGSNSSFDK